MNKQQLIAKYAKKFAFKGAGRTILEGIHYGEEGVVFVTDARFALKIRNAHQFPNPSLTLHAVTGIPIDGQYPNFSKVFPTSFDNEIMIDRKNLESVVTRARCAADVATRLNKKAPVIKILAANGTAYLQLKGPENLVEFQAFLGNTRTLEKSQRSLNAEYLHTALSVFADSQCAPDVVIKFKGPTEPIVLTDGVDIDVLILPYRVSE